MTFQSCTTCRRQRRREKAHGAPEWGLCVECFSRRQKYSDHLHRDRAYRSYLARHIAGYPCDRRSDCPHHAPDYQYFKYPRISFVENRYTELIKTAFVNLRRERESNITGLELLSAHHASLVKYCQACYCAALERFVDNHNIRLCQNCQTWAWIRVYPRIPVDRVTNKSVSQFISWGYFRTDRLTWLLIKTLNWLTDWGRLISCWLKCTDNFCIQKIIVESISLNLATTHSPYIPYCILVLEYY